MKASILVTALIGLTLSAAALAQSPPPTDTGKRLFTLRCAMCHNAAGMGTGLLSRRMKPEVAELEKRDDLSAAFVVAAARSGILNMPVITRGDVNDQELALIANYLSKGRP